MMTTLSGPSDLRMRARSAVSIVLAFSLLGSSLAQAHSAAASLPSDVIEWRIARNVGKSIKRHPYRWAAGAIAAGLIGSGAYRLSRNADRDEDDEVQRFCVDADENQLAMDECDPRLNSNAMAAASLDDPSHAPVTASGHIIYSSNSQLLTRSMEAATDATGAKINVKKPSGCAAHHIVMAGKRKNLNPPDLDVIAAQQVLSSCGIDINSFYNGVYLPDSPVGTPLQNIPLACRFAANHRILHTDIYKATVAKRLEKAEDKDSTLGLFAPGQCPNVKFELLRMKLELQTGGLK